MKPTMPAPLDPQQIMAAAEAAMSQIRTSLDADQILDQLRSSGQHLLHQQVHDQLRTARMQPGLPAADIAVDAATHFARQVWRRRSAV